MAETHEFMPKCLSNARWIVFGWAEEGKAPLTDEVMSERVCCRFPSTTYLRCCIALSLSLGGTSGYPFFVAISHNIIELQLRLIAPLLQVSYDFLGQ